MHPTSSRQGLSPLAKTGVFFLVTTVPIFAAIAFGFSVPLWAWIIYFAVFVLPTFGLVMSEIFKRAFGEKMDKLDVLGSGGGAFIFLVVVLVFLVSAKFAQWFYGP
jgi:hypothetical protein